MTAIRADRQRVLAVASSGGHWVQLRRLSPAFEDQDVAYVTTDPGYRRDVGSARFYTVRDANRWNKLAVVRCALAMFSVLLRERPSVVISTGAAPGYLAIRLGARMGARTVWIDSVANVEELSLSGRMASAVADLCLTQWPHLAGGRVHYLGAVL
jgi:UDP-N-acetylglucosamine:LPS N-acetylglucosamine transferase